MDAETFASLGNLAESSRDLSRMADDPGRASWTTRASNGITLDVSRSHVSTELFEAVAAHAVDSGVFERFDAMLAGDEVNPTEHRPALHVAGRTRPAFSFESRRAAAEMARVLATAGETVDSGTVRAVVNIGIGGSDLGPAMVTRALRRHRNGLDVRFVSNIDGADLDEGLAGLDPASTLVVVVSKTFTTLETMHNAARTRDWFAAAGVDWRTRIVAVTADPGAAAVWGIDPSRCLVFDEGVGGRFSVSSAVGFAVACAIGPEAFSDFLSGMAGMDDHVASTRERSIAFLHAATWFAHHVVHRYPSVAVVPYSHDLARLPAFLQQLVMESNGKSVSLEGVPVTWPTSPVVWGEPGTNGQHAFFQFIHQGTHVTPVEFVGVLAATGSDEEAHDLLLANLLAQSDALARGRSLDEVVGEGVESAEAVHRVLPGNRPNSVLLMDDLSPRTLGALVALYEHSTVLQGWMCSVNSFDQFGVELGKSAATAVAAEILGTTNGPATRTHPLLDVVKNRPRR